MRSICVMAWMIMLVSGCHMQKYKVPDVLSGIIPNNVSVGPSFTPDENRVYAVVDASAKMNKDTKIMTQEFEKALLGQGFLVAERSQLGRVQDELAGMYNGSYNERRLAEIGKMIGVKAFVFINVYEYHDVAYEDPEKPDKPTKCPKIFVNAEAVEVQSAKMIWSGTLNRKIGWFSEPLYPCDCPVNTYAGKATKILAKRIRKAVDKKARKLNKAD